MRGFVVKVTVMTQSDEYITQLLAHISADPAATPDAIFASLSRLLAAPAPANSCALPGTVGEVIRASSLTNSA